MIQKRVKKFGHYSILRGSTTSLIAAYNCKGKERKFTIIIFLMKHPFIIKIHFFLAIYHPIPRK